MRVVIVGGSLGGVRTAQALRSLDFDGQISLYEGEEDFPYDKPPLSKRLLEEVNYTPEILLDERSAQEAGIDLHLGMTAAWVDPAKKLVGFDSEGGTTVPYDVLVIATGASARPSPWGYPEGLHTLRTLADARALRTSLQSGNQLVVIGAGFIGAEVAAAARSKGLQVTMVDPVETPLARVLSPEVAERFAQKHRDMGVTTLFGQAVSGVAPAAPLRVELSSGATIEADTVVVGIGAAPNDAWLSSSGLAIDDGLLLDDHCRAVGQEHIYGVGDVARWEAPTQTGTLRLEHWTNAVDQAAYVAREILNEHQGPYRPTPYVWSDQYDWKIQIVGETTPDLTPCWIEEDADKDRFAVLYSDAEGVLKGAVVVNWPKALVLARRHVPSGSPASVVHNVLDSSAQLTQERS